MNQRTARSGTPYDGTLTPLNRTEWNEAIISDEGLFKRGLREIGFEQREVRKAFDSYQQHLAPILSSRSTSFSLGNSTISRSPGYGRLLSRSGSRSPGSGMAGRLSPKTSSNVSNSFSFDHFLSSSSARPLADDLVIAVLRGLGYKFVVKREQDKIIKVPLFKLHSPRGSQSLVTYQEATALSTKGGWHIEISGSGMGATQSVKLEHSTSFVSEGGDYKLIFAPIPVHVSLVEVYKDDQLIHRGLRTEARAINSRINDGAEVLTKKELEEDLRKSKPSPQGTFYCSKDNRPTTEEWEWSSAEAFQFDVGLKAFDLNTKTNVSVDHEHKVNIKAVLPPRHNYQLRSLAEGFGCLWKILS
jgi:hypothetical protein